MELPKYQSHKVVGALKIKSLVATKRNPNSPIKLIFEDDRYEPLIIHEETYTKHQPKEGWYYVEYPDGYVSFSPPKPFEEGYTLIEA